MERRVIKLTVGSNRKNDMEKVFYGKELGMEDFNKARISIKENEESDFIEVFSYTVKEFFRNENLIKGNDRIIIQFPKEIENLTTMYINGFFEFFKEIFTEQFVSNNIKIVGYQRYQK